MKVALVTGSAGDGRCGVGDYAWELAQHLALDAEVHVFYGKGHGPAEPPFKKLTTLHTHKLSGFSLLTLNRLLKELRQGEFDIIHIQYPSKGYGNSMGPAFLPQNLAGMHSRSRLILTLHEWHTSHPLRKMVMDQMLPHIDSLVVTNEGEMPGLTNKLGPREILCLPVGNVLRSRAEIEAVWLEAEGKPVEPLPPLRGPVGRKPDSLFHYGLPARGKGLMQLLEAVHLLREAGLDVVLKLAGEFPPGDKLTEEVLGKITELELGEAVERLGPLPRTGIAEQAESCMLGVFPFAEGYSSKRSSIASLCHLELPIVVGAGSKETHPFYASEQNNAASLSVLLLELLKGRLAEEWMDRVSAQREYGERFSFAKIAQGHIEFYQRLRRIDV